MKKNKLTLITNNRSPNHSPDGPIGNLMWVLEHLPQNSVIELINCFEDEPPHTQRQLNPVKNQLLSQLKGRNRHLLVKI